MRATVGLLDRNIKIVKGDDQNNWGFGVLIYGWVINGITISGSAVIKGVQFSNGGQYGSTKAALNVINTAVGVNDTIVSGSSF